MKRAITILILMLAALCRAQPLPPPPVPALVSPATNVSSFIVFEWRAPTNGWVRGYRIYWGGIDGIYTNTLDVGNVTNVAITNAGWPIYAVCRAYDDLGEGEASNMSGARLDKVTQIIAQTSVKASGPFADAINVVSKTNAVGAEFYRLRISTTNQPVTFP